MPTIGPDKLTRARRDHRCDLCGLRIRRRATYYVREGVEGREHRRLRMHAVCRHAAADWGESEWEAWIGDGYAFRWYELDLTPAGLLSLFFEILGGARRRPPILLDLEPHDLEPRGHVTEHDLRKAGIKP